jgi:hypothetical protein
MYEILIDTTTAQQRIKRKEEILYPACVCVDGIITLRLRSGYLRLGGPMKAPAGTQYVLAIQETVSSSHTASRDCIDIYKYTIYVHSIVLF